MGSAWTDRAWRHASARGASPHGPSRMFALVFALSLATPGWAQPPSSSDATPMQAVDPAGDAAFDAALPRPAAVAITVDPGPRFAFGSVAITGRAPPTDNAKDQVRQTPERLGLVPGAVARSTVVLQSEKSLTESWRQLGYPKAEIARRDAVANHPTSTLDVGIDVRSGPPAVYGPVTATGTSRVDAAFAAFMTGLKPGMPYDPDDLKRATKNLRRLGVFSSQRLVEADCGRYGLADQSVDIGDADRGTHLRCFVGVGAEVTVDEGVALFEMRERAGKKAFDGSGHGGGEMKEGANASPPGRVRAVAIKPSRFRPHRRRRRADRRGRLHRPA